LYPIVEASLWWNANSPYTLAVWSFGDSEAASALIGDAAPIAFGFAIFELGKDFGWWAQGPQFHGNVAASQSGKYVPNAPQDGFANCGCIAGQGLFHGAGQPYWGAANKAVTYATVGYWGAVGAGFGGGTLIGATTGFSFSGGAFGAGDLSIASDTYAYSDKVLAQATDLYHSVPDSLVNDVISNGDWNEFGTGQYGSPYFQYYMPGAVNGAEGMFEVGGHWIGNNFWIVHTLFSSF
jgi:hypothetical protein